MRVTHLLFFFILFSFLRINSSAQEKSDILDRAKVEFALFHYADAREMYEDAYNRSKDIKILSPLAKCCIKLNDYNAAANYLTSLIEADKASEEDKYELGNLEMTLGRYDNARIIFDELYRSYPSNSLYLTKAQSCDSALVWQNTDRDRIYNMLYSNSEVSDIAPVFFEDNSMVFASEKMDYETVDMDAYINSKESPGWNNENFYKLYQVDNIGRGNEVLTGFIKTFNNTPYHSGPICFNQTYDRAYVTLTNYLKIDPIKSKLKLGNREEELSVKDRRLMLFESRKNGMVWTTPSPMLFNNAYKYNMCHASISPDGRKLFFASDMPGGFGKFDIWYVTMDPSGNWSAPQNCGSRINTAEDELFPNINKDGSLYFASKGHHGLGGLDIFRSQGYSNFWGEPKNLKSPINSSYDDFGLSFSPLASDVGLFSSNRPQGKGSDDVYGFVLDYRNQKLKNIEFYVFDDETSEPLTDVEISIEDQGLVYSQLYTDGQGMAYGNVETGVTYQITANKKYYREAKIPLSIHPISEDKIRIDIPLIKSLQYRDWVEGQTVKLKNLYYDFDKANIRPDAARILDELVVLMKEVYPQMNILLTSHTDSRGSSEYNQKLSQRRADAAWNYLVAHGISGARVERVGMGESNPDNNCTDGVKCSEQEYQENRRTEIKVISLQ